MSHLLAALHSRRGAAERRALVVMAVLVLVWGYSWILSKMALAYCGPLELATMRTAIGTTALFPALVRVCKPVWPEHPWEALGVGVVQTCLFMLLNNWALSVGERVLERIRNQWSWAFGPPSMDENVPRSAGPAETPFGVIFQAAGRRFESGGWLYINNKELAGLTDQDLARLKKEGVI